MIGILAGLCPRALAQYDGRVPRRKPDLGKIQHLREKKYFSESINYRLTGNHSNENEG